MQSLRPSSFLNSAAFYFGGTHMDDDLRLARKASRLTLAQVAAMFGLSREWLRLVEKGEQPITLERKDQILQAISRLTALRSTIAVNTERDLEKVKAEFGGNTPKYRTLQPRIARSFKNRKTVAKT
jgi:transcriptional regulator with XRE-family HTH domain